MSVILTIIVFRSSLDFCPSLHSRLSSSHCAIINPRRACAVRVTVVVVSVCLCVCVCLSVKSHLTSGASVVVKTLPRTPNATKVKRFVAFFLKLCHFRATALPALYGYHAVGDFSRRNTRKRF